jgi:hypothetical protein
MLLHNHLFSRNLEGLDSTLRLFKKALPIQSGIFASDRWPQTIA